MHSDRNVSFTRRCVRSATGGPAYAITYKSPYPALLATDRRSRVQLRIIDHTYCVTTTSANGGVINVCQCLTISLDQSCCLSLI